MAKNVIGLNEQIKKRGPSNTYNPNGLLTIRETYERFGGSYEWLRKAVTQRLFPEALIIISRPGAKKPKIFIDPIKFEAYLESHRLSNILRRGGEHD